MFTFSNTRDLARNVTNVVKFYSVERCPARGSVRDIFLHAFEQILRRSKISVKL